MKTNRLYIVAALLGTVLAGCQRVEELKPEEKPEDNLEAPKTAKLTVQATKGTDTKALTLEGNVLSPTWAIGETVNVFLSGEHIGSLEVMSVIGGEATLEGDIATTGMEAEQQYELTLLFPGRDDQQWTYLGQNGISPSDEGSTLADSFDYAKATLTITYTGSAINVPEGTVDFWNQQNIYRFSFNMPVTSFTVSASSNQLIQTLSYAGGNWTSTPGSITVSPGTYEPTPNDAGRYEYFVSLRNESTEDDTYYFSYVDETDGALYEGVKAIKAAALVPDESGNVKFVSGKVTLAQKVFAPATSSTIDNVSEVL